MFMKIKFTKIFRNFHLDMGGKFTVAMASIIALLLVSSLVAALEFRSMSDYVKDKISDNITSINLSSEIAVTMDEYNTNLLSIIGKADSLKRWNFDPTPYQDRMDTLMVLVSERRLAYSDELSRTYHEFMDESLKLDEVIVSDFKDTRDWYFRELQPKYNEYMRCKDNMNKSIQTDLQANSVSFDDGFYRSLIPTIVSLLTAALLCLLLLFYILVYYATPISRMRRSLDAYLAQNHPYRNQFDGDDSLSALNSGITELADENILLKKRLRDRER